MKINKLLLAIGLMAMGFVNCGDEDECFVGQEIDPNTDECVDICQVPGEVYDLDSNSCVADTSCAATCAGICDAADNCLVVDSSSCAGNIDGTVAAAVNGSTQLAVVGEIDLSVETSYKAGATDATGGTFGYCSAGVNAGTAYPHAWRIAYSDPNGGFNYSASDLAGWSCSSTTSPCPADDVNANFLNVFRPAADGSASKQAPNGVFIEAGSNGFSGEIVVLDCVQEAWIPTQWAVQFNDGTGANVSDLACYPAMAAQTWQ